jgi:orotate phosphoribosyltransferase
MAEPSRQRLLTLLREHAFEEREVVLSSGQRSNFYIDCKTVTLRGEGHVLIGQLFAQAIETRKGRQTGGRRRRGNHRRIDVASD